MDLHQRAAEIAAIPDVTTEWKRPRQSGAVLVASVDGRPIAFLTGAAAEVLEQHLRGRKMVGGHIWPLPMAGAQ